MKAGFMFLITTCNTLLFAGNIQFQKNSPLSDEMQNFVQGIIRHQCAAATKNATLKTTLEKEDQFIIDQGIVDYYYDIDIEARFQGGEIETISLRTLDAQVSNPRAANLFLESISLPERSCDKSRPARFTLRCGDHWLKSIVTVDFRHNLLEVSLSGDSIGSADADRVLTGRVNYSNSEESKQILNASLEWMKPSSFFEIQENAHGSWTGRAKLPSGTQETDFGVCTP